MEESFKYHIPEDIPANERTAFHGAAAAAAKAGKKNFNFAGKTHPVTMKKDTAKAIADQKESTMSFREKLMSLYESDRAKHYKSAAEAEEGVGGCGARGSMVAGTRSRLLRAAAPGHACRKWRQSWCSAPERACVLSG